MKLAKVCASAGLFLAGAGAVHAAPNCQGPGVYLQVLGSGGPELTDKRASSGYLIWHDGRARILVDMGPGSLLRFEESGARIEDLDMVLLTHLHVDHSADLPALVKASFFTDRNRDLPVYGPTGNYLMPDTVAFVEALFSESTGAYRYLAGYLTGAEVFRVLPHNISAKLTQDVPVQQVSEGQVYKVTAVPVHHGPVPALAWRVDIDGHSLAFSGDMNGFGHTLPGLAAGVDVLVAHHAVPQGAVGAAHDLHMTPAEIGEIAAEAKVKQLVLSHRMNRTLGRESESQRVIRKRYAGPIAFAEDGQCFPLR